MPNSKDVKPIVVHEGTKTSLDEAKEVPYESYDDVIRRLLKGKKKVKKNE